MSYSCTSACFFKYLRCPIFTRGYSPSFYKMSTFRRITLQTGLFILSSILAPTSSQTQGSIHLSLFHRDSSSSPLYDPLQSPYDRVRHTFLRSKSRLSFLINKAYVGGDFQGNVEADDGEYFVKFKLGTPPVQMLASVDTASDLVLTKCINDNQTKSLSYDYIACNSPKCTLIPTSACDSSNMCNFSYGYPHLSHSNNLLLGTDTFAMETSNGKDFPLENIVFGCEYDDNHENTSTTQKTGVLGLGFHDLSLIMQVSSITEPKFTYCLRSTSDLEAESRLVLGNGVFLDGQTTSLKVIDGRYNLVLEGISIGKRRLLISPKSFQLNPFNGGGVIIDAGTTLTFLTPDAYYQLVEELERELGLFVELRPDLPYERCYNGKLSDIIDFQGVIFHFEREVNVLSDVENLFLQVEDDKFCLGVLPSPIGGASVLGSLFQQSHIVGYHLGEMLVSFQRIECEVLERHLS